MSASEEEKRIQIIAQFNAINYMASSIARVCADVAHAYASGAKVPDSSGGHSAKIMEQLGDILNGMDAVTEDDVWLTPIFETAQSMWKKS